MFITEIDGNNIIVKRGQYGSQITEHFTNAIVNQVDAADADLIEVGDDFGFSETRSFFDVDGQTYSPPQGQDVENV